MQFIMLTDKLLKMRNSFKINKFYKNPCQTPPQSLSQSTTELLQDEPIGPNWTQIIIKKKFC